MAAECSPHELVPSAHSPPAAAGRPVLRLRGGAIRFGYCTPEQMERMFEKFYPRSSTAGERDATIVPADADSEIAALEAKLTALKAAQAKEGAAQTIEKAPTGADFRDALLVTLRERKVTAAQLQSFFVTHRKCSAAEALADVGSIVVASARRTKLARRRRARSRAAVPAIRRRPPTHNPKGAGRWSGTRSRPL